MTILQDLENTIISADRLNDLGVPSASIAILDNGHIYSSVITNGNENSDTVYQACSISKAITALAVAKLVDEGRISYETKIVEHLSESTMQCLVDAETKHLLQHVTVGMLLSHTSGFSQGGFPGYAGEPPSVEDTLAGRPPSNTLRVRIVNIPGLQWSYSGGGFTVLQLVLEDVTKTPFNQLMQELILRPLGMTRSWYGTKPSEERNYAKAYITGSVQFPGGLEYHNLAELAAAGLWTTPTDLLRATNAVQEALCTNSGFIKQETAEKMLTQVSPGPPEDGMGLGWFINDDFFAHGGTNNPGYNTYVLGARVGRNNEKDARVGLAIMTNSSLGHEVAIKQITSAIFYLKGWQRCKSLPSLVANDDHVPYAMLDERKIGIGWKDWVGSWGSDWRLNEQDGFPALQYKSMQPIKMYVAAAPVSDSEDGKDELFFVVNGLKLGLRLTWEDEVRQVRVIRTLTEDSWGHRFESEALKKTEA